MLSINALSISPAARDWLANSRYPRFLNLFERACNLINERKEVMSIVTPQIGNGPFNLVVEEKVLFNAHLTARSPVFNRENQIHLGDLTIHTANARLWNPCPDWETLHARREDIIKKLESFPVPNCQLLVPDSLISNLFTALCNKDILAAKTLTSKLAGLGGGLTPTGDDIILGALLATWIIYPFHVAKIFAEDISNAAAPLTTSLSAAWLRSAGRGEAGILWQEFFEALIDGTMMNLQLRVDRLLSVGDTSGSDALAGFLGTFVSWAETKNQKITDIPS